MDSKMPIKRFYQLNLFKRVFQKVFFHKECLLYVKLYFLKSVKITYFFDFDQKIVKSAQNKGESPNMRLPIVIFG